MKTIDMPKRNILGDIIRPNPFKSWQHQYPSVERFLREKFKSEDVQIAMSPQNREDWDNNINRFRIRSKDRSIDLEIEAIHMDDLLAKIMGNCDELAK